MMTYDDADDADDYNDDDDVQACERICTSIDFC